MKEKTCAIVGRQDLSEDEAEQLKQRLFIEISRAIDDGYTRFISGIVSTVELCFAEVVAEKKKENPNIKLEAALPTYREMKKRGGKVNEIINACDCMESHRNRFKYMAQESERLIAVYTERDSGNTEAVTRYAMTLNRDVYIVFS